MPVSPPLRQPFARPSPTRIALLYEWLVFNTTYTGICLWRPRAMEALILTLFTLGEGSGLVQPVELVDDGREWRYERSLYPLGHATCVDGVVKWQ
jgi:hypothetical protein